MKVLLKDINYISKHLLLMVKIKERSKLEINITNIKKTSILIIYSFFISRMLIKWPYTTQHQFYEYNCKLKKIKITIQQYFLQNFIIVQHSFWCNKYNNLYTIHFHVYLSFYNWYKYMLWFIQIAPQHIIKIYTEYFLWRKKNKRNSHNFTWNII